MQHGEVVCTHFDPGNLVQQIFLYCKSQKLCDQHDNILWKRTNIQERDESTTNDILTNAIYFTFEEDQIS